MGDRARGSEFGGLAYRGSLLLRSRGAGLCNKAKPPALDYGPGACCRRGLRGLIGGACGALSTPLNRPGIRAPVSSPQRPQFPPHKRRPVSLTCRPTPGPLYPSHGPRISRAGVGSPLAVTCPTTPPPSIVPRHKRHAHIVSGHVVRLHCHSLPFVSKPGAYSPGHKNSYATVL